MEYEVIEYQGKPARKYPDGSIRNERGHWLVKHPAGTQITHETASSIVAQRWKQATERVAAEVTAEMRGYFPDVNTPQDAYSKVVAKQAVALLDSDKPRLDDADKLGQIMGLRPSAWDLRQERQELNPLERAGVVALAAELARRMVAAETEEAE